ncbi:hypothetical protein HX082_07830 [Myroides odoratimimus]|uniref:hypothetical protein n=1 Tax=Myroides odoratimimus TaxID=76832 RepID=UPI00257870C3|nr:hypothetical protein [Myroides odoratimimus]MDM1509305.1 hypothetical protein [Myroides odoratimimus]MEC4036381.1 hypothetical protein [Myroides odoratimimus]MEC4094364.1 hypothetical protein [Myroides odoratimimus]
MIRCFKIVLIVFLVCYLGIGYGQEDSLKVKFDKEFYYSESMKNSSSKNRILYFSNLGNSFYFMHLGPVIDALTLMYDSTKDIKYLNDAQLLISNILNSSVENSNGFKSWKSYSDNKEYKVSNDKEWMLYEGHLFRYISKYAYYVSLQKDLSQDIIDFNQVLISFIDKNVWDKWMLSNNNDLNVFLGVRLHNGADWANVALYMKKLSKGYGQSKYANYLKIYNSTLHVSLINFLSGIDNDWSSVYKEDLNREIKRRKLSKIDPLSNSQDLAHGNHIIEYLINSFELEKDVELSNFKRFDKILKTRLFSEDYSKLNVFMNLQGEYKYIDVSDGWMKLSYVNKEFYQYFSKYFINNVNNIDESNSRLQYYAVMFNLKKNYQY